MNEIKQLMIVKSSKKSVFLIIFLLFSFSCKADMLDSIKSNSKVVIILKNIYKAYNVNHIISDQQEMINIILNDSNREELNSFLDSIIIDCEKIKNQAITNDTLKSFVEKHISSTIKNYKIMKVKGFDSKEFNNDYEIYQTQKGKYMDYLADTYPTNRFVRMTEDKYWQIIDKKNYIKSKDYKIYNRFKKIKLMKSLAKLEEIINQTSDFQEKTIYQIELADQHVKNRDTLEDAEEYAIKKYEEILEQKKYCLFLYETWLKWRTVYQDNNGASKMSEIPNDEYNKMREQVDFVILKYIENNETDEMAINQFLLIATHDIVRRFGDYPYGNQNIIEFQEIFEEK